MYYKSCRLLEHGLFIDKESISSCCIIPNPNSEVVKLFEDYDTEKIDFEHLIEQKENLESISNQERLYVPVKDVVTLRNESGKKSLI